MRRSTSANSSNFIVTGDEPLRSNSDAPLLCLPLPQGAEGDALLRAKPSRWESSPTRPAASRCAARYQPGSSGFSMSYLLRSGSDRESASQRDLPDRRCRCSRSTSRTPECSPRPTGCTAVGRSAPPTAATFTSRRIQVDPGETVAVDLTSLPVAQPLPRLASVGFVVVITALLVGPAS